jgi:hypothetical protein
MTERDPRTITQAVCVGCHETWEPRQLPQPTHIRPGPAKVCVFRARVEAGESLFHPHDAFSCPEYGRVGLNNLSRQEPWLSIWSEEGEREP